MVDILKDTEKQIVVKYNTREEALNRLEDITKELISYLPDNFLYTNRVVKSTGDGETKVIFTIEEV